ncbi:3-phosphoshikimate 1-carboxyvinyltransferase [Archaeoglobus veneficus]|uniref:3-phosphoshikimate 1-carboxyvinyltransferase n=1 Tax=Archaeoglobus veneficus (strain DSM 11195 / SNP6) TaxID=693661 RepID=F2KNT1_ARCVS|nr:3-phosphoshikimate 1-carboxyvinyltransferase [Archaeoglobus veneficus]AEA47408.1 3-phosphoshikimate 1-carboxyvinyltransferase [Archaeoglobus veneficus SNP6]
MDVRILRSEVDGKATPPPSKSYTHRAFIAASLSPSALVENPLFSDDTLATLKACRFIGAEVTRWKDLIAFRGVEDVESSGYINVENSGTTLRLFLGILSHSKRICVIDGDSSLRKRPNRSLALTLNKLGAKIWGDYDFKAPLKVCGIVTGGEVSIRAESSQFISSLLFSLPLAKYDSEIKVEEVKSRPYIDITLHVLEESGIEVKADGKNFYIPGEQSYSLKTFSVPADFSSASYLIAAGLLAGRVEVLNMSDSRQGDKRIVDIAKQMGGNVRWDKENGVITAKQSELEGIEVDASDIPDLVPTIAVLAAVARGKTTIYNAEHLRIKEIDRIDGCYKNLRSLGIEVEKRRDGLVIKGGSIRGGTVDSFGDHRMALAFSLLGLVAEEGVTVKNAEVVSVSFPGYFDVLKNLSAKVEWIKS